MKGTSGIPFSPVVFDGSVDTPRYRQLYAHIRKLIMAGAMPAGTQLPSSRQLAAELGIARNTVMAAYELLLEEQFVESASGRGTVVCAVPAPVQSTSAAAAVSKDAIPAPPLRMPFAVPDSAQFPAQAWSRILRNVSKWIPVSPARPPVEGDPRLRKLVCAYLGAYRGVPCHEDQVLITTGGQQGLYLAGRVLRRLTAEMCIEEPGYLGARRAFRACGFRLHPVSVDEGGARLEADLPTAPAGPMAVYLTPSHQYPLGPTLSLSRRIHVLNWACQNDGWIVEDDYDGEFRYDGEPLTALSGLDSSQRVIYVGTFSKVLSPELRVGYVVVPEQLLELFRACKEVSDGPGAVLMQTAIADFIEHGYFQAHLRRMRSVYRGKRDRLLQLLRRYEVPIEVQPRPAGMHVLLTIEQMQADLDVARRMAGAGFETLALSRHYLDSEHARQGLLVGFTGARDEDLEDFVSELVVAIAASSG